MGLKKRNKRNFHQLICNRNDRLLFFFHQTEYNYDSNEYVN